MKTLYIECAMGAAGDMLAAALLELLPDRAAFLEKMNGLGIPGVTVSAEKGVKCGVSGTHFSVRVAGVEEDENLHSHHHDHVHGSMEGIEEIVNRLPIPSMVKLDVLGHDDPTIIKHMENMTGVVAQNIPLGDPDTMSLFTSNKALKYVTDEPDPILGDIGCIAVPEFGTKFVRGMVKETKPTTFDELFCISGLSHGTDVWLGNAQDLVHDGIPLKECICCRDDIMNYLIGKGVDPKLSFQTMESVRKGKGLKPEMEEAMKKQDVPDWYIDSCKKIKYMFPKAHAVAYVIMAYRIAWFKVHKPLAFYSAYFSIRAKAFDASCMVLGDTVCLDKIHELQAKERDKTISAVEKDMMTTLEVVHEFYHRGFVFEPMDIYKSEAKHFVITEKGLIPPFSSMPGVGEQAAQAIVEERKNGPFLSQEEIVVRCSRVSKSVVETLASIGALSEMPTSTQVSLF